MVAPGATLYDVPAGLCVTLHEPHAVGAASERRFEVVVPRKREEGEKEAEEAEEAEEVVEEEETEDAVVDAVEDA
jgi:hypothetical protein